MLLVRVDSRLDARQLLQQLMAMVEQELVPVVKTNPGRRSNFVDIEWLSERWCFVWVESPNWHVGSRRFFGGTIGVSASGHGLHRFVFFGGQGGLHERAWVGRA